MVASLNECVTRKNGNEHRYLRIFQAYYVYFHDYEQFDALPVIRHFEEATNACQSRGGATSCNCSTDATKWMLHPPPSMTDLFFCLPSKCECKDGSRQDIVPMVCEEILVSQKSLFRYCYYVLHTTESDVFHLIRGPQDVEKRDIAHGIHVSMRRILITYVQHEAAWMVWASDT